MKVLHLPHNIASQISITVRALCDLGIDARGLALDSSPLQDDKGIKSFPLTKGEGMPGRIARRINFSFYAFEAMRWADIIHWNFAKSFLPVTLDLKYAATLGKASVIEFWGSDIRIPEIAIQDNPFTAQMYQTYPELALRARQRSLKAQADFARYGFECLIPDFEMEAYVQKDIFPVFRKSRARIIAADFIPKYPNPYETRPLVVHAPSKKELKGSEIIAQTIDILKKQYAFDFQLISGFERSKAIEIIRNSDIVIDEIVSGSYGLLACEAMALGKPVIGYLKPSVLSAHPADIPIVNANQNNLKKALLNLLQDGNRRHAIGKASRTYVEKYHDANVVAKDLIKIYQDLLKKKSERNQ